VAEWGGPKSGVRIELPICRIGQCNTGDGLLKSPETEEKQLKEAFQREIREN